MNPGTLDRAAAIVRENALPVVMGKVVRLGGLLVEATIPNVRMGDLVQVESHAGEVHCEVVGFRDGLTLAIPLGEIRGVAPGARVRARSAAAQVGVGTSLLGRVVDAFGSPLDGGPPISTNARVPINAPAPPVSHRSPIRQRFNTGVRVIDGLLTCGRGQRVGIFAGAGVGKSVLVEQIASQSVADVIVVGLIGERGREVRELMSAERRDSMVIVAATSDRSPMERARGACTATAIAEYFRDQGATVLLLLDSLTRYAMALREIGLSVGEPPATKGYPPSVFAALPRLLERASPLAAGGSITAFYTVLVEGDDLSDPLADAARSLLDAHIVLSREMAGRGHFPAIDVLRSASRVALQVTDPQTREVARRAREVLARRDAALELQSLGAYAPGKNPVYDESLAIGELLDRWMQQPVHEKADCEQTMIGLRAALDEGKQHHEKKIAQAQKAAQRP